MFCVLAQEVEGILVALGVSSARRRKARADRPAGPSGRVRSKQQTRGARGRAAPGKAGGLGQQRRRCIGQQSGRSGLPLLAAGPAALGEDTAHNPAGAARD